MERASNSVDLERSASVLKSIKITYLIRPAVYSVVSAMIFVYPGIVAAFCLAAFLPGDVVLVAASSLIFFLSYLLVGSACGFVVPLTYSLRRVVEEIAANFSARLEAFLEPALRSAVSGTGKLDLEDLKKIFDHSLLQADQATAKGALIISFRRLIYALVLKKAIRALRLEILEEFSEWVRENGEKDLTIRTIESFVREKAIGRLVAAIDARIRAIRHGAMTAWVVLLLAPFGLLYVLPESDSLADQVADLLRETAGEFLGETADESLGESAGKSPESLGSTDKAPKTSTDQPATPSKTKSQGGSKAKFEPTKPHANVATIGQIGHGKTALTSAITKVLAESGGAKFVPLDQIRKASKEKTRGITIEMAFVEYETKNRHYAHADWPRQADYVKAVITGAARVDGAILVVSARDGPTSQTKEQVRLAGRVGVPAIVIYINDDGGASKEQIDQAEIEARRILEANGYPGDAAPVVTGPTVLERGNDITGRQSILKLLQAVDEFIPQPARPKDGAFLMPIEDVFSISGRGTVATGRVERGIVKVGEDVEIVGLRDTRRTVAKGVEMFRKLLDQGEAGDNIGVLLADIGRDEVERGQVLAKPGSILPHRKFEAEAYILTKDEGGRDTPILNNHRPQFYFRTTDVTGVVTLPEGTEKAMPGDNVSMSVELIAPIAMEAGLRFAIREGGRTVGAGVVVAIGE